MNKETFARYISNPSLLDNETLPEIKSMLDEFPYFQSAWVLYIKNLHTIKDIRYESKLKTACAYISDRKHLHDILKGTYIPAISPVQTQFIAPQPEEIAEDVQTQFIASQQEIKEIEDTEIQQSSSSATPCEQDMTQDITTEAEAEENIQPQNIVDQSNTQESEIQSQTAEPEPVEPQIFEAPDTQQAEFQPEETLSLADRILRQVEEMRKAKAAAQESESVEPQNTEAQPDT